MFLKTIINKIKQMGSSHGEKRDRNEISRNRINEDVNDFRVSKEDVSGTGQPESGQQKVLKESGGQDISAI
jgi:hypothetical protein